MLRKTRSPSVREYLTVKEAAEFLGVSPKTLRNWDRAGKLIPSRHPMNGYRLYVREELEAILENIAKGGGPEPSDEC